MNQTITYQSKNVTVKIERVFTGDKAIKELILELLLKRYKTASLHL